MSEPGNLPSLLGQALLDAIRLAVREEIVKAMGAPHDQEKDRLLTAEEAATLLGMSKDWLFRHHAKLPFTRRIGRRAVRFSSAGIQKWLGASKKS